MKAISGLLLAMTKRIKWTVVLQKSILNAIQYVRKT